MKRNFLRIADFSSRELRGILSLSSHLKQKLEKTGNNRPLLKDKTLAMIFEKPSLRTRVSFEVAMTQLGGHAIYLGPQDIQMGKRETPQDIGRVTSSMVDAILARVFSHKTLEALAQGSQVPVINGLSDLEHPCQILADFLTIKEIKGTFTDLKIAYVGDAQNNVTHSLAIMCSLMGVNLSVAAPKGYWMKKLVASRAKRLTKRKSWLIQTRDPKEAVKDADVVITDTWVSMGDEKERQKRLRIFPPYQVNSRLLSLSQKDAIFMHCLPAYRGKEVSHEVIDGTQSVIHEEAENRLHAQKGLLAWLFSLPLTPTSNESV